APGDAVALEVIGGEIAAQLARLRNDGLPHVAVDEESRAVLGEPFERLGELLVAEGRASLHQRAAGGEDRRRAGACGQDRGDDGEEIGLKLGQRKSLARGAYGGLDEALHRHPAQRLVDGEEAGHDARRGTRAEPDVELLLGGAEIGVDRIEGDLAFRPSLERRLGEEVEQVGVVAAGAPRHEEAAPAGRGEYRLGDEGHEGGGERRVERVAAVIENFGCGARGQLMPGSNNAFAIAHALHSPRYRHARPRAGHPRFSSREPRKTWMAGTSPAMTLPLKNRQLAEALLERGELVAERLRELGAEGGEMLLDQGQLGLPALLVDAGQRSEIFGGDLQSADIERAVGRQPADLRLDRLGRAVAALEDPFQHAAVLA